MDDKLTFRTGSATNTTFLLTSFKDPSFPILRGALQNYLAKSTVHQFATVQVRDARKLVKGIVQDPDNWKNALQM